MKKITNYIIAGVMLIFMASCDEDISAQYDGGRFEYVGINANAAPASIFEGNGINSNTVTIPVRYGSEVVPGRDITVNFTLSGDAVYGTDFTLAGVDNASASGFSVTLPSDTSVVNFTLTSVTNVDLQENRNVVFEIGSTSDEVSIGYPYAASYTLEIADDDCTYNLVDFTGESQVTEVYGPESTYGPYDPAVTASAEADQLLVGNFWDWGWPATIDINTADYSVVFTAETGGGDALSAATGASDWEATGTGVLSTCGNEIVMEITVSSASFGYTSTLGYTIIF